MANARVASGKKAGSEAVHLQVFLSYRREDSAGWTGRLYDALAHHFGTASLFMDIDDIPLGRDFVDVLEERLRGCDAILAVIGRRWATVTDEGGTPRLQDPDDFVRLEIEEGLRRKIPLIPVLVDGASLPKRDELPATCIPLVRRMAVSVTHEGFRGDVQRIFRALGEISAEKARRAPRSRSRRNDPSPPASPRTAAPTSRARGSKAQATGAESKSQAGAPPGASTPKPQSARKAKVPAPTPHAAATSTQRKTSATNKPSARAKPAVGKARTTRSAAKVAATPTTRPWKPTRAQRLSGYGALVEAVLLERNGDDVGARDAYRRAEDAARIADESGNAEAAYVLGQLLLQQRDIDGSMDALRRADQRGHADAASRLGSFYSGILYRDSAAAEAAYRRGDERGSGEGSYELAKILADRGDLAGAKAAFRRALKRNHYNARVDDLREKLDL